MTCILIYGLPSRAKAQLRATMREFWPFKKGESGLHHCPNSDRMKECLQISLAAIDGPPPPDAVELNPR
jgi:hypothetical protein